MSDIVEQFNHGQHDEAIQAAVKAIDAHPKDPKRYAALASMVISIKAYDEASKLIVQALGLFPKDAELTYDAGLLAFAQENYQLAVSYFNQLVARHESAIIDAQYMLALCYQALGQVQKATAFALTAHEADPKRTDAALLLAQLLLSLGAFSQASDILKPLLPKKNAQVLFTYGMAETSAGRDGQKWLDEAKKLDPADYKQKAGQLKDIAGFLKAQGK